MASVPLRDAHVHIAAFGEEMSCVSAAGVTSAAECLALIARAAESTLSGRWIKVVGASVEAWREKAWPTARELSDAAGGRDVVLFSFDHHALVAGESVLRRVGITRDTPDPERGVIVRDPHSGEPTGLLLEEACRLVYAAIPEPDDESFAEYVRRAVEHFAGAGYEEVHDMLATPRLARVLLAMEREGALPLRVWLYAQREAFEELAREAPTWRSQRVRLAGLKIFTDGTLNSRTAWMLHPFADPLPGRPCGSALASVAVIAEAVRFADRLGYPIAAHAIGDGAVRACLDAIEQARPSAGPQRIEHAQFIDEADVVRFAALNVVASMQPSHLLTDAPGIWRLTPARAGRAFALRDLVEAARRAGREARELVWLGSDAPIVPPRWEDTLAAATLRRAPELPASESVAPEQAISQELTLELMRAE